MISLKSSGWFGVCVFVCAYNIKQGFVDESEEFVDNDLAIAIVYFQAETGRKPSKSI